VSTGLRPPATPSTRSHRAIIGAAIVLFAVISAYLALVIITRVDSIASTRLTSDDDGAGAGAGAGAPHSP